tara:strand:+ start:474 stop:785 length:312 start_codon:yes stop_codon:yes gene_type:complete
MELDPYEVFSDEHEVARRGIMTIGGDFIPPSKFLFLHQKLKRCIGKSENKMKRNVGRRMGRRRMKAIIFNPIFGICVCDWSLLLLVEFFGRWSIKKGRPMGCA